MDSQLRTSLAAAQVEKPVPKTDETEGVTGESGEKKKRKRQKKSKAGAETNGDVATMEVDKPAVTNGASSKEETLTQTETSTSTKIDLKETLASKIPEKGKSVSLAECFGDLPADQIKEALAGLRVQRGKKDRFELSIGYT